MKDSLPVTLWLKMETVKKLDAKAKEQRRSRSNLADLLLTEALRRGK